MKGFARQFWAGGVMLLATLLAACGPVRPDPHQPSPSPSEAVSPTPTPEPIESLRVMTWNIQTVGDPGSLEFEAAKDVLARVDADLIAINEVNGTDDSQALAALASQAGYDFVKLPDAYNPGSLRNAVIARVPFTETLTHTSPSLSEDLGANDMTRNLVEVSIRIDESRDFSLLVQHWKAGTGDTNEFRRAVESRRIVTAIDRYDTNSDLIMVVGDVNEEIGSVPQNPPTFTSLPTGLPTYYVLGDDLETEMTQTGINNDPFDYVLAHLGPMTATQLDGDTATRPASGRRLDYLFASQALLSLSVTTEIYDSEDEGMAGGLPKAGNELPANTCLNASDHLPVFVDIRL